MGPEGHPGDVRVIFTRTSPPAISTSYTRPRSMMFISSSGSFTWRSAWRTASSVSSAGTVITLLLPSPVAELLLPNLAGRVAPHQAAAAACDPPVHPARHGQHARQPERPRQPP